MPLRDKIKYWKYNNQRKNTGAFCFAPFNTLRFSVTGQVQICCRNRYRTIGNISENSIETLWNNNSINNFRESLRNYNLYDGCQFCEQMLHSKNYFFLKSLDYDSFQEKTNDTIIRKLEFELSNICNFECIMCSGELSSSIRKHVEHLDPIPSFYNDDFITQLRPLWKDIRRVIFGGGEPFLNSLYYKIWDEIQWHNPAIESIITTNGSILNEQIKLLLEKGNYFFTVSMDSFEKETFEQIRKKSVFENVMNNFEYFYEYSMKRGRWITINVCPLINNWKGIPSMINYMNKRSINVYFNQVDFPLTVSLRSLTSHKLIEIYQYYTAFKFELYNNYATKQNLNMFSALVKQIYYLIKEISQLEKLNLPSVLTIKEAKDLLIKHFINKSRNFYNYSSIVESSVNKINDAIELIRNENAAIEGIKIFCQEPDYIFVSEIVYTTAEKLAIRLQQSFKTHC